jgi:hypothetical protein
MMLRATINAHAKIRRLSRKVRFSMTVNTGWLAAEVLAPVAHPQWVFTLPKRLRLFFLYDRRLLGALSRCAWSTVRDVYRAGLRDRRAVPGMVVSIQTYGDLANWHPRSQYPA